MNVLEPGIEGNLLLLLLLTTEISECKVLFLKMGSRKQKRILSTKKHFVNWILIVLNLFIYVGSIRSSYIFITVSLYFSDLLHISNIEFVCSFRFFFIIFNFISLNRICHFFYFSSIPMHANTKSINTTNISNWLFMHELQLDGINLNFH